MLIMLMIPKQKVSECSCSVGVKPATAVVPLQNMGYWAVILGCSSGHSSTSSEKYKLHS